MWTVTGLPPRVCGLNTPPSGHSSETISGAPSIVIPAWPIEPSLPWMRRVSTAPNAFA